MPVKRIKIKILSEAENNREIKWTACTSERGLSLKYSELHVAATFTPQTFFITNF